AAGDFNGKGAVDLAVVNLGPSTASVFLSSPTLALYPAPLNFGKQLVGSMTPPQQVTVSNPGPAPLQISSITISNVAAGGDFAAAMSGTTCNSTTPVAVGLNCTVAVTFTPSVGGSRAGTLSISDNAPGSPQMLVLAGTGEDFSLGPASGASTSATVTAGQTATYMLSVAPIGGLNQAVSLTCSGAPSTTNCTISPASPTLDGSHSAPVTVTVTTTARSLTSPGRQVGPPAWLRLKGLPLIWLVALASLIALAAGRRRRVEIGLVATLALVLLWAACGGGNAGGGGTPAGTYSLTVSGTVTSGQATVKHDVTLTLTVN
ncbi:MAG TPA: choice-of-anchor D domain-containing protein, partial [Terriglobia bacterium]|nr:choice-of-anchor D domain-containing protein [Terriglobia bacterium]